MLARLATTMASRLHLQPRSAGRGSRLSRTDAIVQNRCATTVALLAVTLLGATAMLAGCANTPSPRQPSTSRTEVRARKKVAVKRSGNAVLVQLNLVVECQTVERYEDQELPTGWVRCNRPPPPEEVESLSGVPVRLHAGTISLYESTDEEGVATLALESLLESTAEPREAEVRIELPGEQAVTTTLSLMGAPVVVAWRKAAQEKSQLEPSNGDSNTTSLSEAPATKDPRLALTAAFTRLPLSRDHVDTNAVRQFLQATIDLDPRSPLARDARQTLGAIDAVGRLTPYPRISLQGNLSDTLGLLNDRRQMMSFVDALGAIVIRTSATVDALASKYDFALTQAQREAAADQGSIARDNARIIRRWGEAFRSSIR